MGFQIDVSLDASNSPRSNSSPRNGPGSTSNSCNNEKPRPKCLKVALLGGPLPGIAGSPSKGTKVGKSCLKYRWAEDSFPAPEFTSSFMTAELQQLTSSGDVLLQIWEQEPFNPLGVAFYRGVDLFILVFDITDKLSLEYLSAHLNEIRFQCPTPVRVVLCGNKADLAADRQVSPEAAEEWCKCHEVSSYFETSAKTGERCEDLAPEIRKVLGASLAGEGAVLSYEESAERVPESSRHRIRSCCEVFVYIPVAFAGVLVSPLVLLLLLLLLPLLPALLLLPLIWKWEKHCGRAVHGASSPQSVSEACNRSVKGKCESERGAGRLINFWRYCKNNHPLLSVCFADKDSPLSPFERITLLLFVSSAGYLGAVIQDKALSDLDPEEVTTMGISYAYSTVFIVAPTMLLDMLCRELALLDYKFRLEKCHYFEARAHDRVCTFATRMVRKRGLVHTDYKLPDDWGRCKDPRDQSIIGECLRECLQQCCTNVITSVLQDISMAFGFVCIVYTGIVVGIGVWLDMQDSTQVGVLTLQGLVNSGFVYWLPKQIVMFLVFWEVEHRRASRGWLCGEAAEELGRLFDEIAGYSCICEKDHFDIIDLRHYLTKNGCPEEQLSVEALKELFSAAKNGVQGIGRDEFVQLMLEDYCLEVSWYPPTRGCCRCCCYRRKRTAAVAADTGSSPAVKAAWQSSADAENNKSSADAENNKSSADVENDKSSTDAENEEQSVVYENQCCLAVVVEDA
eukprot:TRINITY_DN15316_c0_g1_i1.p1 TRINITY_DN15316_c0_g1~~TRINITY_DN15316_c0_g1_i1.p1  ORF type:complete len:757 (+),score=104.56 TRINITY_DN15316_c0_g1_i1:58-2271(+)